MADLRLRELVLYCQRAFATPVSESHQIGFSFQRREERNTTVVAACDPLRNESGEAEGSQLKCSCTGFGAGANRMSWRAWAGVRSARRWVSRWWSRLSPYYASWCATSG